MAEGFASQSTLEQAFAQSIDEVARHVGVDIERGLAGQDVGQRQRRVGKNRLRRHRTRGAIGILTSQLRSLIVWLLAAAAGLSSYVGDRPEGLAIIAVIVINTAIGIVTELRALRSMEALRRIARVRTGSCPRHGRSCYTLIQDRPLANVLNGPSSKKNLVNQGDLIRWGNVL